MKRLLLPYCLLSLSPVSAQIHNGGFEDLNDLQMPAYWQGNLVLIAVSIDSNGVSHSDSVVFDGGSNYLLNTTDVHAGNNGIELRNGFNFTSSTPIAGVWTATDDSTGYTGFPVVTLPVVMQPSVVRFYAKYFPVGTDTAQVLFTAFDEGMNGIGTGTLALHGTYDEYTLFEVPVQYTEELPVAFISLSFTTAINAANASFGTRLLIDDVSLVPTDVGVAEHRAPSTLSIFPDPTEGVFTVRANDGDAVQRLRLFDPTGREAVITALSNGTYTCGQLAPGVYVVKAATLTGEATSRLVVR